MAPLIYVQRFLSEGKGKGYECLLAAPWEDEDKLANALCFIWCLPLRKAFVYEFFVFKISLLAY